MIIKTARHINNVVGYVFVFENKLLYPEFLVEKESHSTCSEYINGTFYFKQDIFTYYYWWWHFPPTISFKH